MQLRRVTRWMLVVAYVGLIAVTVWLLSLDTLAQADAVYPMTALVLVTGVLVVMAAVRRYQRLDELSQRIHLIALAVAFVGMLVLVFTWSVVEFFGVIDDGRLFWRVLSPTTPRGLYVLAGMSGLYVIGWVWGRLHYR